MEEGIQKQNALVVGGTSGLGLAMARLLRKTHDVRVTGRQEISEFPFQYFNMSTQLLGKSVRHLARSNDFIDTLVIAAGFLQRGTIDQLSPDAIVTMVQTNITGPALLVREVLLRQDILPALAVVTSTSEWMPRRDEPIYAASKRGLAGLAESLAEDPRIAKTLVVAPSKMATKFWSGCNTDSNDGLDPHAVAEVAVSQLAEKYVYRHVKVLRDPFRVEVSKEKIDRW